jgi:5-methylcytosine-specific restriction endonuclease McrA
MTTGTRCELHEAEHERNRRTPSQKVTETARWKKLRAKLIRTRPWVCAICGKPIRTAAEIEADHIEPVSEGGAPYDPANVRLSHRSCNRRRRASVVRKPWPTKRAHLPPWMLD